MIIQLSEIIADQGEIGKFELGIFTVTINRMDTFEHELIHL
jgi:hypothetical protein